MDRHPSGVPNEPFVVGTPTPIVVKAAVVNGRLRLRWNVNPIPGGVRIESRSLRVDGSWTLVQTVSSGQEREVELSGEGRMYRVRRD